ncbi:hypothetical protein EI555_007351 [Monodon monoceros]|uniref:BTB domain-containing protein n=1 Tax=Monodon monoceros TaxID=40151 RepID=A0A4U1F617_MONMO|nr:hypothetical protein EI555_007351 [Monodon monoceros]
MSRSGDRTSTFDPSHSDNLLHGLNLLWRKQLFCDVTLTAQGQQFHCHKAVLASCSQYFRSLFSSHPPLGGGVGGQDGLGPPKDQQPPQQQPPPPQEEPGTPSSSPDDKLLTSPRAINNLVLQGCSSIGLRLVLEYLYTANVTLSLDTVEEVLSVSKILHIPQVTKLCVQFLNDQISVQNYKQVCKIAALHGLEETKKLANKYLVEDVLLLNFEEMRALLDSLPPPVESELALFQMSVLWLEHDRETRMQYAPDLMKRLRFALIPAPELVERVQSVDFMRTDPVCQKLLLDAMNYHLMPFRQHCRQSLASRGESLLFLISYIRCRAWFAAALKASGVRVWLSAPTAPASGLVPLKTDEASEMERRTKRERPSTPQNQAHRNILGKWKGLEEGMENLIRSNKKMLLLVGGLPPGPDRLPSNLVQYYDDEKKTWKILTKTLYKGSTNNKKLNGVEENTVRILSADMIPDLIAGYNFRPCKKGFSHLDVMLVECYDPKGDQWNILQTPILEGRSGPGCAVLDDSIYLVGGYSWSMKSGKEAVQGKERTGLWKTIGVTEARGCRFGQASRIMMSFFKDQAQELPYKESLWSYEIRRWFTKEMSFEQDALKQNLAHTSEEMMKWN